MPAKYILLFGGESDERLVSFASAQFMAQTLKNARLWYWHEDGKIYEISKTELCEHQNPFTVGFIPKEKPLFSTISGALTDESTQGSVFVLGLHGGAGENGVLQEMLEKRGLRFTGSDSRGARLAFDKIAAKACLLKYDIKMPQHVELIINSKSEIIESISSFFERHGDMILKPACGGSSLGCFFIRDKSQIKDVVQKLVSEPFRPYLGEKVIIGRELTVGVIQRGRELIALPPTEIVLQASRDFDYEGKYLGLGSQEITPAAISLSETALVQEMALTAHKALGLSGYSRSDMILARDGLYFLETNTLPGLTPQSLVPQQLAAANITMGDFLREQIELAI